MTSTPAVYPTSLVNFTTKVNHVDVVNDDDANKLQNEVIALQTYVGTNPQGSKADLTTRIAQLMATNGAFNQGTAFPTNPVEGQGFWRTDQITFYIYGNSAWNSLGQSLSNTIFSVTGPVITASLTSTNITSLLNGSSLPKWIATNNNAYSTCFYSQFKKLSGISTIKVFGDLWTLTGNVVLRTTIGSVSGTLFTGSFTPTMLSVALDVSGLNNGTIYDLVAELQQSGASGGCFLHSITGIAS